MSERLFLVADVGGTNTRVALANGPQVLPDTVRRYSNREFANLAPVLRQYRVDQPSGDLDGACVAVAGPVSEGRAELTNLDWSIDATRLIEATGAHHAAILNDLQAQGHAVGRIADDKCETIIPGPDGASGARLVIGVGTGFNAAPVHETAHGRFVPPCEAGHANLPIRTEAELSLCNFVSTAHGFPAVEDVLSGRGLEQVYRWLCSEAGTPDDLLAAEIMAQLETNPQAAAAVQQFIRILGTVAGNLALIHLPLGGIYLVGGVARAMGPHLDAMGFDRAFSDKGRFAGFMSNFPVHLVCDDYAALAGGAAHLMEIVS